MILVLHGLLACLLYSGTVARDSDGDGGHSAGDVPLANVVVSLDGVAWTRTGSDGRFVLFGHGPGLVWVRVPEGYRPRATYARVDGAFDANVNLVLEPDPSRGPLRFVHASDSHVGVITGDDLVTALAQAGSGEPAPRFIVMTGDVTQDSRPREFADYADAVATSPVPVVSVAGNHDGGEDGAAWADAMGPMAWSFDAGGVHFVVLSALGDGPSRAAFIAADAAFTPPGMPVAALLHYALSLPYDDALYRALLDAGAKWLFSGHYHGNRTLRYEGLTEFNVEPLVFGGIDGMPAGYQAVTFDGEEMHVEHTTVTEGEVFEIIHPEADACVGPDELSVVVDVVLGQGDVRVTASVDGARPRELERGSAWAWRADLSVGEGTHTLRVEVTRPGEPPRVKDLTFCVAPQAAAAPESATWSQLGGGAHHAGAIDRPLGLPGRQRWATPVGGHVRSPVAIADGRLFVPVVDYGTGTAGGLVALDAASGAVLWAHREGGAVHGSPAVDGGIVVFATVDGRLQALDAATGAKVWELPLDPVDNPGARVLHNGVAIEGGTAYGGSLYHFVAVDVASGAVVWEQHPDFPPFPTHTYATAAVAEDLVVAPLALPSHSVFAKEVVDGSQPWASESAPGTTASPVLVDGLALLASANTLVSATRLSDGGDLWRKRIYGHGHDFAFWLRVTPAASGGHLFVPTHQGELLALRLADGSRLWSAQVGIGLVHGVHYEAAASGINAPPVVTGGVVWLGADDGILRALDGETGALLASRDLGAPITGLSPGAATLYVTGWDGVVRAIACDQPNTFVPREAEAGGCRVAAGAKPARGWGAAVWTLLPLLLLARLTVRGRRGGKVRRGRGEAGSV